ncbi:MAG: leucine-rich repeat protein [Bacteroidales bacterium]|nr:leucine-rich repeat protein [Bacteroidales bacterium]
MKNKRFLLTIFMMAIVGWQSAFALDWTNNGLVYTTKGDANEVSVRAQSGYTFTGTIDIPGTVTNAGIQFTVVEIESGAFANSTLTNVNVTIPATVATIGQYAFINGEINTLTINRNSSSALTIGKDAFANTKVTGVVWNGTVAQWCAVSFFNLNSNPVAVKEQVSSNYVTIDGTMPTNWNNTIFPTLTLGTAINVVNYNGEIGYNDTYTTLLDKAPMAVQDINGNTVYKQSSLLVLPAEVTNINELTFAKRSFATIKAYGAAPAINANTFSHLDNTDIEALCDKVSDFETANIWSTAKSVAGFVDYVPSAMASTTTIYSPVNPSEVAATITYTKPSCETNSQWILKITPKPGYSFARWSGGAFDNNTEMEIRGNLNQAMPVNAFVDRLTFLVTVNSEANTMGTTSGNITSYYNDQVTITAQPNSGYKFIRWSNGVTDNPYQNIQVTGDTTLTAYFDVVAPFDRNLELNSDFSNAHQNNLWAFTSNSKNRWAIVDGKMIITNDGNTNNYDNTVATTAYAYRVMNIKANTYYKLSWQYKDYMQYAMVPATDAIKSGDFSAINNWNSLSYPYSTPKNDSTDFNPINSNAEYVLVFKWDRPAGTLDRNYAGLLDNVIFKERKFHVSTNDATVNVSPAWVYSGETVTLTAPEKAGYTFSGWSSNSIDLSQYTSDDLTSNPIHITPDDMDIEGIYANYIAKDVTIVFKNDQKGTYLSETNGNQYNDYLTANHTNSDHYGLICSGTSDFADSLTTYGTIVADIVKINAKHGDYIDLNVDPIVSGWELTSWKVFDKTGAEVSNDNFTTNDNNTLSINMDVANDYYTVVPVFTKKKYEVVIRNYKDANFDVIDTTMGYVTVKVNGQAATGTVSANGNFSKTTYEVEYMDFVELTANTKLSGDQSIYVFAGYKDANNNWVGDDENYNYTNGMYTFVVDGFKRGNNNGQLTFDTYFDYKQYKVTAFTENLEKGNIKNLTSTGEIAYNVNGIAQGAGKYINVRYRNTVMMEAERYSGYMFTGWVKVNSTNTADINTDTIKYNPYTFSPTADVYYKATFKPATDFIRDTVIYNYNYVTQDSTIYVTSYVDTIAYRTGQTVDTTVYNYNYVTKDTVVGNNEILRDTVILNPVYVNNPVYVDTVIYNYVNQTVVTYHDTVIYITSYQPQYVDTIIYNYINQPVYHYVDTTIYNPVYIDVPYYDTIAITYDSVITICNTDTITLTYYDTIINNVHDTTIVTRYDTVYLPQYIYDTVYVHDTVVVGINDVDKVNFTVSQVGNQIAVSGAENNVVRLFDVVGHMLATKQDPYGEVYFDAPATGTYLVKVGNYQAKRIVVVL